MKPNSKSKNDARSSDRESKIWRGLSILGAAFLIALVNGCASPAHTTGPDPWEYNPNTGYPAVGGLPYRTL